MNDSGWTTTQEKPDYLLDPVSRVSYTYDKAGNRLTETRDGQQTVYAYDKADQLLRTSDGTQYYYDNAGNLTAKVKGDDEAKYEYNAAGKLTKVSRIDETYVAFAYDAFGRKVQRTEWVALGNPHGTPPGLTDAKGKGNNEEKASPGKGEEHGQAKQNLCSDEAKPLSAPKPVEHKKLKLREETTSFLYDGLTLNVLKEYKGQSVTKAEYYYANGQVLGRKMFGLSAGGPGADPPADPRRRRCKSSSAWERLFKRVHVGIFAGRGRHQDRAGLVRDVKATQGGYTGD